MSRCRPLAAALVLPLLLVGVAPAQRRATEPLVEQVGNAIEKAKRFLRSVEKGAGNWERDSSLIGGVYRGGTSALALLALLNAGVKPDDPVVQRGLEFLRRIEPEDTYVVGLQTMVFVEAGSPSDLPRVQKNVDWLIEARVLSDGQLQGWGYGKTRGIPDNSNTQYALLGLHAGRQAGARIDRTAWRQIQDYYTRTQRDDGGWPYTGTQDRRGNTSSLTMTIAGLCGLYIAAMELNADKRTLRADGSDPLCGSYSENDAINKALAWLSAPQGRGTRLTFTPHRHVFYNVYGIERAGRLSGRRVLAGHDWYRDGCKFLVDLQHEDGAWFLRDTGGPDASTVISTSFALLFLSKGRTPVVISKFAHGAGEDWNRKHNDLRHLVDYASTELFRRTPLAWQSYDARRIELAGRDAFFEEVGSLVQSPIVYLSGHEAPRLTDVQKRLLKQYVEEGGFLLGEACCGSKDFARGFRALMAELFPETPLRPLRPEHPIWLAHAPVPPNFVALEGIEQGCKTVVVFSLEALGGYWEINDRTTERGQLAFRLAGNVVAYATGMEPPPARLTQTRVHDPRDERRAPRGYLKAAQVRHEGDWQPAPRAIPNLMRHLRAEHKLDVALQPEELRLNHPDLFQYKFLYMHGRTRFELTADELENLRANLKTGGLLLADACCGKKEFDQAFRALAEKLIPGAALEPIPATDPLYSADLTGAAIASVRVRREKPDGTAEAEFRDQPPQLEGIRVKDRWVVIYSKYDLGCALEKHSSSDCKGHDHASALRLATAAVLYALKK